MDPLIDIGPETDREHLIEKLIKQNSLINGFFKSVPGTFIVLDNWWQIQYIKGELGNIPLDEALLKGKTLDQAFRNEHGHLLTTHTIEELLKEKEKTVHRYSNTFHKWFKISAARNGALIFIRLEDVTMEEMTKRMLMLNEYSISQAGDMVLWITPQGRIIYANISACQKLKHPLSELANMKIQEISPTMTDDNWTMFKETMKNVEKKSLESSFKDRDGRQIPVEMTINHLTFRGEEYYMAFARDITERKRIEEELKNAKQEAELYLDLMGHDLNNMHQIALGYLELANSMPPGKEQTEFIDKSAEVLQRSTQLINNVKKLQKLHDSTIQTQDTDVIPILRDIQKEYGSIPNKHITLNIKDHEQCTVKANELLHEVYANLITNAIRHTGDKADITINADTIKDDDNQYCRVIVEDNGPGIPDEKKTTIFNRTLKGSNKAKGMGIGLYIVKTLVDTYGGRVWTEDRVHNDHTKGARFIVILPTIKK